jgi:hypothetical protein
MYDSWVIDSIPEQVAESIRAAFKNWNKRTEIKKKKKKYILLEFIFNFFFPSTTKGERRKKEYKHTLFFSLTPGACLASKGHK